MKLAVGICFYQDVRGLERLLSTLPPEHVDYIFAIDGKFADFEGESNESTDGSRELFFKLHHERRVLTTISGLEVDKRNEYLKLCEVNQADYLLILDSDEYVLPGADWEKFKYNIEHTCTDDNGHIYGVRFVHEGTVDYPRLWYKPYNLEYFKNHNIFRKKKTGEIMKSGYTIQLIEGIQCTGDDKLRDPAYIEKSFAYQKALIEKEVATKRELGFKKQAEKAWREMTPEEIAEAEK